MNTSIELLHAGHGVPKRFYRGDLSLKWAYTVF